MAVNSWAVPKVGNVDPRLVVGIGGAAAAFVGWQWWRKRSDPGTTADTTATDPTASDFADGGTVPGVLGAVSPTNSYGIPDTSSAPDPATSSDFGFHGTTNDQWAQYAEQQLSASDVWSTTDILSALGNYLSGAPLSTLQKTIVQAALAVAGNPPVGSHVMVSGGDTAITVAPVIQSVTMTSTTATIVVSPVSGAASYRAYRSGVSAAVGVATGNTITVGGLTPDTTYSFHVQAVSASGSGGPSSASKSGKTPGVVLATPRAPSVSAIGTTSAHVSTTAVKGATAYYWYVNGSLHAHSDAPATTLAGLHSKTSYKVTVAADTSPGAPSHQSSARSFKTK